MELSYFIADVSVSRHDEHIDVVPIHTEPPELDLASLASKLEGGKFFPIFEYCTISLQSSFITWLEFQQ